VLALEQAHLLDVLEGLICFQLFVSPDPHLKLGDQISLSVDPVLTEPRIVADLLLLLEAAGEVALVEQDLEVEGQTAAALGGLA